MQRYGTALWSGDVELHRYGVFENQTNEGIHAEHTQKQMFFATRTNGSVQCIRRNRLTNVGKRHGDFIGKRNNY
jgi:hypothetical protein